MDASFIKQEDLLSIAPGTEDKAIWINTVNDTYYTNNSIESNSDPNNPGLISIFFKN